MVIAVSLAATSAQAASASRTFSVGDSRFGGTATLKFNDSATSNKYTATVSAQADGRVLYATLPLASGDASLEIREPSNCRAFGSLKLRGNTVATWNRSFIGSAGFTTAPFVDKQIGGQTQFGIGPVTLTFRAEARTQIYAKGSASVSFSPITQRPVVRGSFGPVMDTTASGSGSVSAGGASASVEGNLRLIGDSLTGDVTFAPQRKGHPIVSYAATATTQSTDGTIQGVVRIPVPFFGTQTYRQTLYEYHGGPSSFTLISGSRQL